MSEDLHELIIRAAERLKEFGAREVYVFGSAATGTMRENSDVDLAVSGLPAEVWYRASGQLWDIFNRPFDLVDLDDNNPFTDYLKKKGKLHRVI